MSVNLEYVVAGLLSTIEFIPAERHPEAMLPWANQVVELVREYESEDAGLGATIDDLLADDLEVAAARWEQE